MQNADDITSTPPSREARNFAERMFAIHTRLVSDSDFRRFLCALASYGQIPEPQTVYPDTQQVAEAFGFPLDAVYFFLGRAFSRYQEHKPNVAVAVRIVHVAQRATGTATPFDSGRMRHCAQGDRRYYMKLPVANESLPHRADYVRNNRRPLCDCTDYFAAHLTRYFDRPENYWSKPDQPIDGVHLVEPDWHDWTFELQVDAPVGCSESETIYFLDQTSREGGRSIRDEHDRLVQAGLISGVAYRPTSNPRLASETEVRRRVSETASP